jgi:diguanylate cyclase (GGDEF)-like protein
LHLAFYDPLTELPNRNLYLDRVNHIIDAIKSDPQKKAAILYMDLDKFKQVNDTYGHCVGDKLLKFIGKRLRTIKRENDTIARIGGDEFAAVITGDCHKEQVNAYAQRILEAIEKVFMIDGQNIHVSISIGISYYPSDTTDIEKLFAYADKAMYLAKKSGSKIEFYSAMR